MIKKVKIEIALLVILYLSILYSYSFDFFVYDNLLHIKSGIRNGYLKNFFINITNMGDSLWYFLFFVFLFLFSYFFKQKNKLVFFYLNNFSIFCFLHLFTVGFVTQVIKHIIGRPRPNHTNFDEGFGFNYFTSESIFHSFPSGHSSTIICVCLIASAVLPGLKYFFYVIAAIISLSRVIVGAHFFTDIVAGGLLALIIFKILDYYFKKNKQNLLSKKFEIKNISLFSKINIIFIFLGILLSVGFDFDLYFSSLFYVFSLDSIVTIYGESIIFIEHFKSNFYLEGHDILSIVFRKIFLPFLILYIFILPIVGFVFPIRIVFFNHSFLFKEIVYIYFSGFFSIILLVNGLFKGLWGRARPNDVEDFGGVDIFTPWFKVSQSCESNCSFVSGDASVGFALVVFYFITRKNIFIYLSLLCGISLGFIRIIAGGHFLSDIIFAQIIVTSSMFLCFIIYKKICNG